MEEKDYEDWQELTDEEDECDHEWVHSGLRLLPWRRTKDTLWVCKTCRESKWVREGRRP